MKGVERILCRAKDEVAGMAANLLDAAAVGIANDADELRLVSGKGRNVVWQVVGIGAWEGLAAADWGLGLLGVDELDAVAVIWVDDSGDVEVGCAGEATEADLTQHARNIIRALGDRVPVANPAIWEGGRVVGIALDNCGVDLVEAIVRGEVDGTLGAVLVDKLDSVGSGCQSCEGRKGGDDGETHVDGYLFVVYKDSI